MTEPNSSRRHKLCRACRVDHHDHHVGARCLTPVDRAPLDYVCRCAIDRSSKTSVVLPTPSAIELDGLVALLASITNGEPDDTVDPDETICSRCDVPVSNERDECPFCQMPIDSQVVLFEPTQPKTEDMEDLPMTNPTITHTRITTGT